MRVTRKRLLRGPHRWGVRRLPHPSSKGMRLKASLRPRHRLRVRTRNSGTAYAVTQRFGSRCEHFAFGVGGNLTVLGVFKYANFALMNVNAPLTSSALLPHRLALERAARPERSILRWWSATRPMS